MELKRHFVGISVRKGFPQVDLQKETTMSDAVAIAFALNNIIEDEDNLHSYCEKCLRAKAQNMLDHLLGAAAHAERLGYNSAAQELFLTAMELDGQLA